MGHKNLIVSDQTTQYPSFLKKASRQKTADSLAASPVIIQMQRRLAETELKQLITDIPSIEIIDNYAEQYAELMLSQHAHLYRANYEVQVASIQDLLTKHYGKKAGWQLGSWIYYPWKRQLVHVLAQAEYEDLRTIRNRDLITKTEQQKLYDFNALSFGMSVGSAGALGMVMSGMSRQIKLVDGAVISGSNLNRILTGVSSVGKSKSLIIGQQIYEMNPYASVEAADKVDAKNIGKLFDKPWATHVAIDEIDDIEMKVRIRYEARKRKIPVLMASELGDTVILDVERFDLEPERPLFHNAVPGIEKLLDAPIENYREWTKHATSILDVSNMTIKMQESLMKIGSTIVTHPQLGSTVMMTGGVLAFAVKSLALGWELNSGRYIISLEHQFLANHKTRAYRTAHKKHTKMLRRAVGSM